LVVLCNAQALFTATLSNFEPLSYPADELLLIRKEHEKDRYSR